MARPGLYTPKQLTNSPLAKHTDPKDQPPSRNEGQKRSPCHKTSKAHKQDEKGQRWASPLSKLRSAAISPHKKVCQPVWHFAKRFSNLMCPIRMAQLVSPAKLSHGTPHRAELIYSKLYINCSNVFFFGTKNIKTWLDSALQPEGLNWAMPYLK